MDILVLDKAFDELGLIETWQSLIWTERFSSSGDFKIVLKYSKAVETILKEDNFILRFGKTFGTVQEVMVIESVIIEDQETDNGKITAVGRSVDSFLERRAVVYTAAAGGTVTPPVTLTAAMRGLGAMATGADGLTNLSVESGSILDSFTVEETRKNTDIYTAIKTLADQDARGFKILTLFSDPTGYTWLLMFYKGDDRSVTNPSSSVDSVVFKTDLENLNSTNLIKSSATFKNFAKVFGDNGTYVYEVPGLGVSAGLTGNDKRVLLVDANDIKRPATTANYQKLLRQRAYEALAEQQKVVTFEGQAKPDGIFKFGEHYFMGDAVTLMDNLGNSTKVRVAEYVWSYDTESNSDYPTFILA